MNESTVVAYLNNWMETQASNNGTLDPEELEAYHMIRTALTHLYTSGTMTDEAK